MRNLALALLLAFTCSSCSTPSTPGTGTGGTGTTVVTPNPYKPAIMEAIGAAAEIGTSTSLRALSTSNPAAATETANALKASIDSTILPYLQGGELQTAAAVSEFINSSLFKNVNPAIRTAIAAAASLLQVYLKVPGAGTYLSKDQVDYTVSFMTGVKKGCIDFSAKTPPQPLFIRPE